MPEFSLIEFADSRLEEGMVVEDFQFVEDFGSPFLVILDGFQDLPEVVGFLLLGMEGRGGSKETELGDDLGVSWIGLSLQRDSPHSPGIPFSPKTAPVSGNRHRWLPLQRELPYPQEDGE